MLQDIDKAIHDARKSLDSVKKAPVNIKQLVAQITNDIKYAIDHGEWDLAVKLTSYCHEIAKAYSCLDWYPAYLAVRKARDTIELIRSQG